MATVTGNTIFARARTQATQQGSDPNTSIVVDNLGGARVLLNETIRILYRAKANTDSRFRHDVNVTHTIAIAGGAGTVPDTIMREFLRQADITDDNSSLVTFLDYSTDLNQTFAQLGYLTIDGDAFNYLAPTPELDSYSGDLTIKCPTFPDFPNNMSQNITFPSESIIDDLCDLLAQTLMGKVAMAI